MEPSFIKQIGEEFHINDITNFENDLTISVYNEKELIKRAILLGKRWASIDANSDLAWRFLGYTYYLGDDCENYLKCIMKSVSINPDDYNNWIRLSFAYRSNGDILTSNWINYNLQYFVRLYKKHKLKEINHQTILFLIGKLKEKLGVDKRA